MKTTYSTITLRYLHDVVTGEFANIGVVLYAPEQRYLEARFTTSYERLNAIFLKIDHLHYRALMRYMTKLLLCYVMFCGNIVVSRRTARGSRAGLREFLG